MQITHPQIVFVVNKQFLEACFGHVGEFDFGFFRRGACHTAFGNILFAATGCLNHLVDGAVASGEKSPCENICYVIDDFSDSVDS